MGKYLERRVSSVVTTLLAAALLTLFSSSSRSLTVAADVPEATRFIAIGHLYPIAGDQARMTSLLNRMAFHRPDAVFFLGDCAVENEEVYDKLKSAFPCPVYFALGNHENVDLASYKKNVGYLYKVVERDDARFAIFPSAAAGQDIRAFLKTVSKEDGRPLFLMCHHRIWDDSLKSTGPFGHDPSYALTEILDVVDDHAEYIFAGNSKRQYFTDSNDNQHGKWGKLNPNVMYWCDRVRDLECYSCGMGDGVPKATFVVVDVASNGIMIKSDFVADGYEDPVDLMSLGMLRRKPAPKLQGWAKVRSKIQDRTFKQGVVAGVVVCGLLLVTWTLARWWLPASRHSKLERT